MMSNQEVFYGHHNHSSNYNYSNQEMNSKISDMNPCPIYKCPINLGQTNIVGHIVGQSMKNKLEYTRIN